MMNNIYWQQKPLSSDFAKNPLKISLGMIFSRLVAEFANRHNLWKMVAEMLGVR
jgi:hypothetical protein